MSFRIEPDRRDFLKISALTVVELIGGKVGGAILAPPPAPESKPVTLAASNNHSKKLVLKTPEAKICLESVCRAANIPIVDSVSDLPSVYPEGLNASEVKYCEVVAENIILQELVGRSKNNFLPELIKSFPEYQQDVVETELFLCLYNRAQKFLNEVKGIPYPIVYLTTKYSYLKGREGIFTGFTEQEAETVVKSMATISFAEVHQSVKRRLDSFKESSCWIFSPNRLSYVLSPTRKTI